MPQRLRWDSNSDSDRANLHAAKTVDTPLKERSSIGIERELDAKNLDFVWVKINLSVLPPSETFSDQLES